MVTIDKIVENVGKFNGDIANHRMYERAKENVNVLTNDEGMKKLEETLKLETRYNDLNWPITPDNYSISLGDVTFNVKSELTTKRPQYKTAVTQMENYINGIKLLLTSNKLITGVAKVEGKWCIEVDSLVEQYELIIAGLKSPGVKQIIKYKTSAMMSKEDAPKELYLSLEDNGELTADNFRNYVRKDKLLDISSKYVKDYETKLATKEKINDVVVVNTKKGYKEESTKSEGINWAYIVKTLINDTCDEDTCGELNFLADKNIDYEAKRTEMPFYSLFVRKPFGEEKLYVGLDSVYHRIQDLKDENKINMQKTKYVAKEIV